MQGNKIIAAALSSRGRASPGAQGCAKAGTAFAQAGLVAQAPELIHRPPDVAPAGG